MKTIQMTIGEALLSGLDETVEKNGMSRSAFIREAIQEAMHRARIAEMERQDAEGYAKQPETAEEIAEFEAWQSIQAWGDDWSEAPSVG